MFAYQALLGVTASFARTEFLAKYKAIQGPHLSLGYAADPFSNSRNGA